MKSLITSIGFVCLLFSCQETRYHEGKILYNAYCANCHMEDGMGLAKLYPPIKDADYLRENSQTIPQIIKYGITDSLLINGIEYTIPMSGFEDLNTVQISNIYNYILSVWYPNQTPLSFQEIEEMLAIPRNYD